MLGKTIVSSAGVRCPSELCGLKPLCRSVPSGDHSGQLLW